MVSIFGQNVGSPNYQPKVVRAKRKKKTNEAFFIQRALKKEVLLFFTPYAFSRKVPNDFQETEIVWAILHD